MDLPCDDGSATFDTQILFQPVSALRLSEPDVTAEAAGKPLRPQGRYPMMLPFPPGMRHQP